MTNSRRTVAALTILLAVASLTRAQSDPLPSWNDGPNKRAIVDFVARVTREGGPDFVPAAQRIATFDNDGTLWSEQPIYFQFAFALDRVKALAPHHPEWKTRTPNASGPTTATRTSASWIALWMKQSHASGSSWI
jgi:hypothetical protein